MRHFLIVALMLWGAAATADDAGGSTHEFFLDTEVTAIGQPIEYPEGKPRISAAYGTLAPGDETGWHIHEIPIYIQILEGELTVDYGEEGIQTFGPGEALVEVVGHRHNGKNLGDVPVKTIAVFLGAEGLEATVAVE